MAKFCNQCGRPLEDGEVCNCALQQSEQQNNANQFTKEAENVLGDVVALLKQPVVKLAELAKEQKGMIYGGVFAGLNVLISTFVAIILMIYLHITLSDYSAFLPKIPYVQIPVLVFLSTIASAALTAALLFAFDSKVFHGEATFGSMLTIVGAKSLVSAVCLVIGVVFSVLSAGIGIIILAIGMVMALAYMAIAYAEVSVLNADKKAFVLMIVMAIMTVADFIFVRLVLSGIMHSLSSYVSSMLKLF